MYTNANAFQNTAFDPKVVPDSLTQLKKKASYLSRIENYDLAFDSYSLLVDQCYNLGYPKMALNIFEYVLESVCDNPNFNLERRLEVLSDLHNNEQRFNTEGVYYSYVCQAYWQEEDLKSAEYYYQKATKCLQRDHQYLQLCNLELLVSACTHYVLGNKKAMYHLEKADQITKDYLIPNGIDVSVNLYLIQAVFYSEIREYTKSENCYRQAISKIKNDPSIPSESLMILYYNISSLYSFLEEYENEALYMQECIKIAKDINADYINWIAYPNLYLGTIYIKKGNKDKGLNIILKLLKEIEGLDQQTESEHRLLIEIYQTLIFNKLEKDKKILDNYIKKLLKINDKTDFSKNYSYKIIAKYFVDTKNVDRAKAMLSKARFFSKQISYSQDYDYNNIAAEIELIDQNLLKALAYCQLNMRFLDPQFDDTDLFGNPKFANITDREKIIRIIPIKIKVLEALYQQRHAEVTPDLLLQTAKLAIAGVEYKNNQFRTKSAQRYWLNNKAVPLFEKAIGVALSIHERTGDDAYLNEAFLLSEQSKSMILRSILQDETAGTFGGIPDSLTQKEDWLRRQMTHAKKQLHDASLANDSLRFNYWDSVYFDYSTQNNILLIDLETRYPKYHQLKHQTQLTNIREVQNNLDEGTALIEYFQGKHRIYVFTISQNEAFAHHFPRTAAYDQQIDDLRQQLTDAAGANQNLVRARQRFADRSFELFQLLLASSLPRSKNIQRLMFVLDGKLGYLPFETLITKEDTRQGSINFSSLPYLLNRYSINYNYSALLFIQQRKQRSTAANQIFALAPTYNYPTSPWRNPQEIARRKHFQELPGASNELQFLKNRFAGLFVYKDNTAEREATERAFRKHALKYGILHLAVHGVVDREKPELSGLALEEDSSRTFDNFLYAYEIKQLDLQQTQLVVLAACKTGDGQFQRGEGILSIGRSFMYAGVPSLLTTLWNLNDHTSATIVENFYQYLAEGKTKDEALRQAKIDYLTNNGQGIAAHPQLWACFVQVGDYTSISIAPQSIFIRYPYLVYSSVGGALVLLLLFLRIRTSSNER